MSPRLFLIAGEPSGDRLGGALLEGLQALAPGLEVAGVGGPSLSVSAIGVFLAFLYVWLPYMVLPIVAALERVPQSLIEASGDLGASPFDRFLTEALAEVSEKRLS